MAVVTEMEQVSAMIPPAEPPKRRGRPPGSRNKSTEVDDEDIEVAPPDPFDARKPSSDKEDLWAMVANIQDWTYEFVYLYRVSPTIDRRSAGRQINIDKFAQPFDVDDIKKKHGSGCYRAVFFHIDPATNKYSRYRDEKFDILDMDYPPNVPAGDWVDEPANKIWQWAIPKIQAQQQQTAPNLGAISDMMDKADDRALRMVEIMKPKEDSTTAVLLGKLLDATLATRNAPAPPPPDTTQQDRLFAMLMEDRKQAREELALLREKMFSTPPPKSIIEQFVELQPQIKGLVDGFATRAGKPDIWADIVKEGMSQLPELIELGKEMVKKGGPAPEAHRPRTDAVVGTLAAAKAAEPPLSTKPVDQMTEEEKRAHVDHLWKKWGGRLISISTRLIAEFTIQDQGYSFRDWYCELYGKLNWGELKREIAPDLMTNMYLAHEQLKGPLSPPERLHAFLIDFCTDFGDEKDVTVEDDDQTVEGTEVISAAKPDEAKA